MKFCKNCGSELSENEKELQFCDNCKGALAEKENFTEDENISDAQSIEEPVAKKKKPFNKKALIIVLSSFVALIISGIPEPVLSPILILLNIVNINLFLASELPPEKASSLRIVNAPGLENSNLSLNCFMTKPLVSL